MEYSAKKITIINYTLTDANAWYQVASRNNAIRRWFMKAKDSTDNSFDYDFDNTNHTTFMTNSGQGVAFDNVALPDAYCRSATAGTVIELIYFD